MRTQTIASPSGEEEEEEEPWILQAELARKLVNLLDTRVILVTGEASYHAAYDECTVRFLRQTGLVDIGGSWDQGKWTHDVHGEEQPLNCTVVRESDSESGITGWFGIFFFFFFFPF